MKLSLLCKDMTAGIVFTGISDNFPYFLGFKVMPNTDFKRARYLNKKFILVNHQNLRSDIEKSNISDFFIHDPYRNPNTDYNILRDKLMKLKKTPRSIHNV